MFRNERRDGIERDIYLVPIDLLRYRKDNGRISSDILNYEKKVVKYSRAIKKNERMIYKLNHFDLVLAGNYL